MRNPFIGSQEEVEAFKKAINSIYYHETTCFRDQVGIICQFLRNDSIKVSYERIGKIFEETAHCIWDQHQNFCRGERSDEDQVLYQKANSKTSLNTLKSFILTIVIQHIQHMQMFLIT